MDRLAAKRTPVSTVFVGLEGQVLLPPTESPVLEIPHLALLIGEVGPTVQGSLGEGCPQTREAPQWPCKLRGKHLLPIC